MEELNSIEQIEIKGGSELSEAITFAIGLEVKYYTIIKEVTRK